MHVVTYILLCAVANIAYCITAQQCEAPMERYVFNLLVDAPSSTAYKYSRDRVKFAIDRALQDVKRGDILQDTELNVIKLLNVSYLFPCFVLCIHNYCVSVCSYDELNLASKHDTGRP